ncbi:secretion pathway protein Sls2/Rcy1 [Penicillium riverlandense]|uniref:secretion pathway protein Sls2/Rcy1 n=1 Tax=Penicillium riverlandense TaxID=1903569 RepID=UPI0025467BC8|nr:secretion pathway protein Sls2/Rcy1 [Penicillium riverlandense]KAJ5820433.1 secretion pathway protein Sls2/Rcy1 [Penicillium riverlandense]
MATSSLVSWHCLLLIICIVIVSAAEVKVVTDETTATVIAMPTSPHPPSYTSETDFKSAVLQASNGYRTVHDASPLSWNEELAKYAKNWAEKCIWEHSGGPYGENLAFGYANASSAVDAWGNEGADYNFEKPTGFTEKTGHFTQLVWRSTTEVGCAAIDCGYTDESSQSRRGLFLNDRAADGTSHAQGWYVVCEYQPGGNVVGEHNEFFRKNVRAANSSMTTTSPGTRPTVVALLLLGTVGIGFGLYG